MATGKRKRVVLTIEKKLEILSLLEKEVTREKLAQDFGIGKSTVTDIKTSASEIKKLASGAESFYGCKRKVLRHAQDDKLDKVVYTWFVQARNEGIPISDKQTSHTFLKRNKPLMLNDSILTPIPADSCKTLNFPKIIHLRKC
ncbi:UNVERIFIED_CONTAM: hypothetical protein FKN15_006800 [Acipenser sinensis]